VIQGVFFFFPCARAHFRAGGEDDAEVIFFEIELSSGHMASTPADK
jgi:hypothetical protein